MLLFHNKFLNVFYFKCFLKYTGSDFPKVCGAICKMERLTIKLLDSTNCKPKK